MPEANRPVLLFYCQHSLGIGHLTRSFALAEALTRHFRVVFLNGGRLPPGVPVPDGDRDSSTCRRWAWTTATRSSAATGHADMATRAPSERKRLIESAVRTRAAARCCWSSSFPSAARSSPTRSCR